MISSPRRANPFCKHRKDRLTRALPYFCRLQKVPSSNPSISISSNRSHPPRQCLETRGSSSTSRPAARSWARSSWRWEACYVIFGLSQRRVFWAPKWTNLSVELSPPAYYTDLYSEKMVFQLLNLNHSRMSSHFLPGRGEMTVSLLSLGGY